MKKIRGIYKCHGGKSYLKEWIIFNFPKNYTQLKYCEGCGGSGVILLNKEQSIEEIYNDADSGVVSIVRELVKFPEEFIELIKNVEYNKETFEWSETANGPVAELVKRRMSRGGLGKAFSWSNRLRGNVCGDVNAWNTYKLELSRIAERLKNVKVYCESILELFPKIDSEDLFFYNDPPYVPNTRQSKNVYNVEMTEEEHIQLSELLNKAKGKVLLSGYQSQLYAKLYKNWNLECRPIVNHASQSKVKQKRIECLWKNY